MRWLIYTHVIQNEVVWFALLGCMPQVKNLPFEQRWNANFSCVWTHILHPERVLTSNASTSCLYGVRTKFGVRTARTPRSNATRTFLQALPERSDTAGCERILKQNVQPPPTSNAFRNYRTFSSCMAWTRSAISERSGTAQPERIARFLERSAAPSAERVQQPLLLNAFSRRTPFLTGTILHDICMAFKRNLAFVVLEHLVRTRRERSVRPILEWSTFRGTHQCCMVTWIRISDSEWKCYVYWIKTQSVHSQKIYKIPK